MFRDPLVIEDDFQALLDVCKINEGIEDNEFDIRLWCTATPCGTAGCLVGNWIMYGENTRMELFAGYPHFIGDEGCFYAVFKRIAFRFQISNAVAEFLFSVGNDDKNSGYEFSSMEFRRDDWSRQACLSRLRKYLYYRLHKKEILGDLSTKEGRETFEKARRMEGNHNFINKAIEKDSLCLTQ